MSIASFDPHDGDSNQKSKSLAPRKEQISAFGWTTRQTLSRGCISSSNSDVSSTKQFQGSFSTVYSLRNWCNSRNALACDPVSNTSFDLWWLSPTVPESFWQYDKIDGQVRS